MALDVRPITAALASMASASGLFDAVVQHEPKSTPGATGVTCALWVNDMRPVASESGLASVTIRLEYMMRIYTSMLAEPQDEIDPKVMDATTALFTALCGGFSLAGLVRNIQLFDGDAGEGLRAVPGYINVDRGLFRTMDIHVPMIINDVYVESA